MTKSLTYMEPLRSLIESDQPVKDVVSKLLPKLDKLPEYTGRIPLELCIEEVFPNSWSGWAVYGGKRMEHVGGAYGLYKEIKLLLVPHFVQTGRWQWKNGRMKAVTE